MMRSHELARQLLERPDVELIMQRDAEGNEYSPLRGVDFDVVYVPEDNWSGGEAYHREWTAEDVLMDEEEWTSLKEKNSDYAILFPVN